MKKVMAITIINIILALVQLALALERSGDGVSIAKLQAEKDKLSLENKLIGEEVYTKSSLPYILAKSAELGLDDGKVIYLGGQIPVAAALNQSANQ